MKKNPLIIMCLLLIISPAMAQQKVGWISLFNGRDLSGWEIYLDREIDSLGKPLSTTPLGLNNDPNKVFSVVSEDGQPAIRVSGKTWGGITTVRSYGDYHLRLQFKWGKAPTWGPKRGQKKDSGLLYHSVGSRSATEPWMRSQEFQIEEGNTGDYWGVDGASAYIKAFKDGKAYTYAPAAPLTLFSNTAAAGRNCHKWPDGEMPDGDWNTIDLYCVKGKSIHVVNGKVVMVLENSSQLKDGKLVPLISGTIQLQSEGAELFYRDVKIRKIKTLPVALLKTSN